MSEFKGTKGKWILGKNGFSVVSDNSESLTIRGAIGKEAVKYYGGNLICESVSNHNAKLIACAPEMLEFLYRIESSENTPYAHRRKAKELIKKATDL